MPFDAYRIVSGIFVILILLLYVAAAFRFLRGRLGKIRTVTAEVVGKQTVEQVSKYGKQYKYAVTFRIEGKNKSFYVSEFSYNGYRKGERGKLTYRGDRIIDFE